MPRMIRNLIDRIGVGRAKAILIVLVSAATLAIALSIVDFADFRASLGRIPGQAILLATVAIAANALVSLVRFRTTLGRFGYRAHLRPIFVAFGIGQVSNQFLLNVVGQSLSRAAVLARENVPFGATVIATYWERAIAAGILLVLCLAGAFYLSLQISIDFTGGATYPLFVAASAAAATAVAIGLNFPAGKLWQEMSAGMRTLAGLWPTILLTLLAHALMLAAYLALLWGLDPTAVSYAAAAAILVVMFLASLPISFSGWGIRELSSASALGLAGVDPAVAVAAAVAIGAIALVLTLAWGGGTLPLLVGRTATATPSETPQVDHAAGDWGRGIAIVFSTLTAILIFFQIRVPLETYAITVNVADLLALSSLGFVGFLVATGRRRDILPRPVIAGLAIVSAVILASLLVAYLNFGGNDWGSTSRGLGWLFILGYVAVGACAGLNAGTAGRETVLRVFITAGIAVAVGQIVLMTLLGAGICIPATMLATPLEGYATNANAFGLQMASVGG